MLATIHETVEISEAGVLQLHFSKLKPATRVAVVAVVELPDADGGSGNAMQNLKTTQGLFKGRFPDALELQRQLRSEWDDRSGRFGKE